MMEQIGSNFRTLLFLLLFTSCSSKVITLKEDTIFTNVVWTKDIKIRTNGFQVAFDGNCLIDCKVEIK